MRQAALGKCALHPEVAAAEICERCGAFACAQCLEFTDTVPSQTLCSPCFQRYFGRAASSRAVAALVLGIVGVSGCFFLGLPAWILGQQELEAIERGEAPAKGRNLAQGARWLGLASGALTLLVVALVAVAVLAARR